mmetsp:Transcript_12966/g.29396  ORF Transcript_12966/g.29396 Transcript_12966/m.29396 type:complete len:650 (+) Transcript_12966:66-2015(+)
MRLVGTLQWLMRAEIGLVVVVVAASEVSSNLHSSASASMTHYKLLDMDKKLLAADRSHVLVTGMDVGTPGQPFRCVLDTATAAFWIPSKHCSTCNGTYSNLDNFYNAEKSSTFQPVLQAADPARPSNEIPIGLKFSYDEEIMGGYLIRDTVALGGARVVNQSLLLVEITEPTDMDQEPRVWDGVCGLGWGPSPHSFVAQIYQPFYMGMREAGLKSVFALFPPRVEGGAGYMAVGEVPLSSTLLRKVFWSPHVSAAQMWMAQAAISVMDAMDPTRPLASRGDVNMVIDTGSDYIIAPRPAFDELKNLLVVELSRRMGEEGARVACPQRLDGRELLECECSVAPVFGEFYITFLLASQTVPLELSVATLWEPSDDNLRGSKDRCTFMVRPDDLGENPELLRAGVPQRPFGHHAMQGGHRFGRTPDPIRQHRPDEGESADSIVAKEVISVSLGKLHPGFLCKLDIGIQKDGQLKVLEYTVYDRNGMVDDTHRLREECRAKAPPGASRRLLLREPGRQTQDAVANDHEAGARELTGEEASLYNGLEIWRVGDVFLKRFVTVLDFDEARIGFLPSGFLSRDDDDDDDGFFPSSLGFVAALLACVLAPLAVMALSKRSFGGNPREIRMLNGRLTNRMQTIEEEEEPDETDPFAAE